MQGQSRAGRLGRADPHGRAREGSVGRRAADDQQPHGIDGRDRGARGADQAVPGDADHRQQLCPRRDHEVDPRLAAQRLADRRPQAGQECRAVAGAARRRRRRTEVEWHWVKGHSGHAENDRVDELACAAAEARAAASAAAEVAPGRIARGSSAGALAQRSAPRTATTPRARSGCPCRPAPRTRRSSARARSKPNFITPVGREGAQARPVALDRLDRPVDRLLEPVDRHGDVDLLGRGVARVDQSISSSGQTHTLWSPSPLK